MRAALLACLVVLSPIAHAEPFFESVINAMAIKSLESHTNNSWEGVDKIKGVKWKWPYYKSGAHDSTMQGKIKLGKDKNPNIGATTVKVNGARSFITNIEISIDNQSAELKDFGKGKVKTIKTSCDDDSASYNVAFYQFTKPNHKPLYISQISSWGASGGGGVDFKLAYELENIFPSNPEPCKVLK